MNSKLIVKNEQSYIECIPDGCRMESERDALDLVAICGENHTARLMLHAENLSEDFYQLHSGLAGAILLKFVIYGLRVAAILPINLVNQGHFKDMVLETNRGNAFRVFQTREEAVQWLISK
jgi:PadR family transcriptional regulator, regulatory protein AphA